MLAYLFKISFSAPLGGPLNFPVGLCSIFLSPDPLLHDGETAGGTGVNSSEFFWHSIINTGVTEPGEHHQTFVIQTLWAKTSLQVNDEDCFLISGSWFPLWMFILCLFKGNVSMLFSCFCLNCLLTSPNPLKGWTEHDNKPSFTLENSRHRPNRLNKVNFESHISWRVNVSVVLEPLILTLARLQEV